VDSRVHVDAIRSRPSTRRYISMKSVADLCQPDDTDLLQLAAR